MLRRLCATRICVAQVNNNNNNNSYIALYPVKIDKLAALYIINIKIRLTIENTTNAYINIKLTTTKKARLKLIMLFRSF